MAIWGNDLSLIQAKLIWIKNGGKVESFYNCNHADISIFQNREGINEHLILTRDGGNSNFLKKHTYTRSL